MQTFNLTETEPQVQYMGMALDRVDRDMQRALLQELIESLVGKAEITVKSEFLVSRPCSLELVLDHKKINEVKAKKITIEFRTPSWRD